MCQHAEVNQFPKCQQAYLARKNSLDCKQIKERGVDKNHILDGVIGVARVIVPDESESC